jgi:hypothetical protein
LRVSDHLIRKTALAAALAAFLVTAIPAHAVDSVSFEMGRGNENTDLWRAGAQWKWDKHWLADRPWTLGAYWDLQVGRWSNNNRDKENTDPGIRKPIWDIGFTPVFRLERAAHGAVVPYAEAAIGFHVLSDLRINQRRVFGSKFQYGDHVAAGLRFGPGYRYDAQLRLQHHSNGGLAYPNPGINFVQLRVAYHFE